MFSDFAAGMLQQSLQLFNAVRFYVLPVVLAVVSAVAFYVVISELADAARELRE